MNKPKICLLTIFILCTAVFLSGGEVIEAIVAVVNDDVITLSEYRKEFEKQYQNLRSQYEGEEFTQRYDNLKKNLLESMITDLLLFQEAKKRDMDVSEQVRRTIENIKKENAIESDEKLKQLMRQQGINFEDWKEQIERNQMKQAVIFSEVVRDISVDDSDLVEYYNQHKEEFVEPEEYELSAIYVSSQDKSKEEVEKKKKDILEKLDSGEKFAQVASEYGEGPEKKSQGSLGTFKKGELAENLEKAVEKLEVGERTPWIKIQNGWYLYKLKGKKEKRVKPFDEVRKKIEEKLFNQKREKKMQQFLQELREKNYVKIKISKPWEYVS
ncbi:peptidyl-prolyl cis-trans isomerase [bacterium]|nr:peptidyl-prolyl cis-trans isomerase [bacterium]